MGVTDNELRIEDIDLLAEQSTIEDLMRSELTTQRLELDELKDLLKTKQDELSQANDRLLKKDKEIERLNVKVDSANDDISKLQDGIVKREEALAKKQKDLADEKARFERNKVIVLERQKQDSLLIEAKLKKLEEELFNLSIEKDKLSRDRQKLEIERSQMSRGVPVALDDAGKLFFYGALDEAEIKSRYRSLIKIYHPDNTAGATNVVIRIINHEYERLRGIYKSINSYK